VPAYAPAQQIQRIHHSRLIVENLRQQVKRFWRLRLQLQRAAQG